MYADPKFIKKHAFKVNLDDQERALLELVSMRAGEQPSAYIRKLMLKELDRTLGIEEEDNRRSA